MEHGPPRRRRARPVADAPIDALLVGVEDLAKGWLLALLEQTPLEQAPGILAADLTRDGPRICEAVVRALADDSDLRRLEPGGALEPLASRVAAIAGASDPEASVRAVDALQAVIWSALRAELRWPDADQVSDLTERLSLVCERVRAAALRQSPRAESAAREPSAERQPAQPLRVTRSVPAPEVADRMAEEGGVAPEEAGPAPEAGPMAEEGGPAPDGVDPLWVAAIEDEINQSARSGHPLSLLLAELEDGDLVRSVEPDRESSVTFGNFAQAVRTAVRREDLLACETETRAWIIARETGRPGARALAMRVGKAVEEAPAWRGAPLSVNVGVAVLGEDGHDAASLIEAAEQGKFAAAASGVRVMPQEHGEGNEPPSAG